MTKKNIDTAKFLKKVAKKKEREDKETKQNNRHGSLTIVQPAIEIEEFVAVSKLWLGFGK
jgi:hypothetical protein